MNKVFENFISIGNFFVEHKPKNREEFYAIYLPSIKFGLLIITRLETKVENPGAKHDWAIKPNLSSFKHTAWSSLFQSQPKISKKIIMLFFNAGYRLLKHFKPPGEGFSLFFSDMFGLA